MTAATRLLALPFLLALSAACLPTAAQYVWLDKAGRKVFSDRPPGLDVPERSILKQPGVGTMTGGGAAAPSSSGGAAGNVMGPAGGAVPGPAASGPGIRQPSSAGQPAQPGQPGQPGQDPELAERRRQAEAAETAKRQSDEAIQAAARAENCQRARQTLAMLDSGVRVATINGQGERSFMDEQARAAEAQRAQNIATSDCR